MPSGKTSSQPVGNLSLRGVAIAYRPRLPRPDRDKLTGDCCAHHSGYLSEVEEGLEIPWPRQRWLLHMDRVEEFLTGGEVGEPLVEGGEFIGAGLLMYAENLRVERESRPLNLRHVEAADSKVDPPDAQ